MIETLEGYRYGGLEALLQEAGVNPVHARPLFSAVQRRLVHADLEAAEGILPPLARWLVSEGAPPLCRVEQLDCTPSGDGFTEKYLLRLDSDRRSQ